MQIRERGGLLSMVLDLCHWLVVGPDIVAEKRTIQLRFSDEIALDIVMIDEGLIVLDLDDALATVVIGVVAFDDATDDDLGQLAGVVVGEVAATTAIAYGIAHGIKRNGLCAHPGQAVGAGGVSIGPGLAVVVEVTGTVAIGVVRIGIGVRGSVGEALSDQPIDCIVRIGADLGEALFIREVAVGVVGIDAGVGTADELINESSFCPRRSSRS